MVTENVRSLTELHPFSKVFFLWERGAKEFLCISGISLLNMFLKTVLLTKCILYLDLWNIPLLIQLRGFYTKSKAPFYTRLKRLEL